MGSTINNRQDLFNLVWEKSLVQLSKEYQISDSGLGRVCRRLKIPIPPRGYWNLDEPESIIKKPDLPKFVGNDYFSLQKRKPGETNIAKSNRMQNAIIKEVAGSFVSLFSDREFEVDRHPLIESLQKDFHKKRRHEYGRFEGVWQLSRSQLDVRFSKNLQEPAMRFLTKLLYVIDARGHKIKVDRDLGSCIIVDSGKIKFCLKERMRIVKTDPETGNSQRFVPIGILYLQVGWFTKTEWTNERDILDIQIPKIVAFLEVKAHRYR